MATDLGQQMECAREALGLSLDALASQVGVSRQALSDVEAGDQSDSQVIEKLRAYFARRGISFSDPRFDPAASKSVVDEVVELGDVLEDRAGPHSDPAY